MVGATAAPDALRGTPDAPMIGGIPNAFVLLPSKAFAIRAQDWGYYQGKSYFRVDFTTPLTGSPAFTPATAAFWGRPSIGISTSGTKPR